MSVCRPGRFVMAALAAVMTSGAQLLAPAQTPAPAPTAVPTFHCVGLYWNPPPDAMKAADAPGGAAPVCDVRYRAEGETQWREALPLWFDERGPEAFSHVFQIADGELDDPKQAAKLRQQADAWGVTAFSKQYRGSIVNLRPGTAYDIELSLRGTDTRATLTAKTWSEEFPVAETVVVPESSNETLKIDRSGTPTGYILYTHAPGAQTATIDVANRADQCVEIRAAYVIVRGLTLKGARANAIRVFDGAPANTPVFGRAASVGHDIVIEDCDISGWGQPDELEGEKWGRNMDAGVYAKPSQRDTPAISRLVIQRNRIHHPRYDANAWTEFRKKTDAKGDGKRWHPNGAQAISLFDTAGNHVIRYNEMWGDADHGFNDIIGGATNFCAAGSPNRDTDIYGNRFANSMDDAIEAEGGNCNVRVWANYFDECYVAIAAASTHVGPLYLWRNVSHRIERPFLKAGGNRGFGGGRAYVFHNTLLQPSGGEDGKEPLGAHAGLSSAGGPITNHVSRNNILQVNRAEGQSVGEVAGQSKQNDFDYDLYNGQLKAAGQPEKHGIRGAPVFAKAAKDGAPGADLSLAPDSPGYDAGARIPNFNDDFAGKAPDIGAQESGHPPLTFGVAARWPPEQR